jgi:triosephosphate isomerase
MNNKKIIFNHKMFGSLKFADFVISKFSKFKSKYDFIICPASPLFFKFSKHLSSEKYKNIFLGSQNCSNSKENNFENSNYTGEINIGLLKEFGIGHCIIGHSERRKHFHEDENLILSKMDHLLNSCLTPIVCVRKFFEDSELIKKIISTFINYDSSFSNDLMIAYEPLSAIGTGLSENLFAIEENLNLIRDSINFKILQEKGKKISLIYGGSVSDSNINEILNISEGVLIGKACSSEEKLEKILDNL